MHTFACQCSYQLRSCQNLSRISLTLYNFRCEEIQLAMSSGHKHNEVYNASDAVNLLQIDVNLPNVVIAKLILIFLNIRTRINKESLIHHQLQM